MTHDSLNHLNSQDEADMLRKKKQMRKKVSKIKEAFKKFHKARFDNEGAELMFAESQDSFVQNFKKVDSDDEDAMEEDEKVYRKSLNKLKDNDTKKRRTDAILATVREEAKKQGVETTELLAYMMYRETYNLDKSLSREMLEVSKGSAISKNKVSEMKTLAMVLRGRFGRSTFFYIRRTLRPHKGLGQKSVHENFLLKSASIG